ncbi:GNAT family N-acetyltransferase [Achromobacter sp. SD115]|uniref:GNAT family N-acetyltransferase n=1 Tax=Achromobacter sp. SD115 TaxID=2782011 RepID=UPI001A958176|nr:GNAT family N-acetyltransferase [Achromobacter sp. SD115]MBO1014913.1 GNAT family N-acetyltransferase [Achromobacter sp. SD115]
MTDQLQKFMIRLARPEDAALLEDLLMRTYEGTWMPEMTAERDRQFRASGKTAGYVRTRGNLFMVCEIDGVPAGMADWENDFIRALHVHPARQGQGVGGALLAWMEAAIRDAGFGRARLETDSFNQRSRHFYRKHGYAEIETYPDDEWDSGFTTILLEKRLPA